MIIISDKPGQLANRLIVFSHWIRYAIENKVTILNPAFDDYASYFEGTCNQTISKFPNANTTKSPVQKVKYAYFVSYYIARILHRLNIKTRLISHIYLDWHQEQNLEELGALNCSYLFVQGWQFRYKNIPPLHQAIILDYFNIVEPYKSNVNSFVKSARTHYTTLVGIHIRHGDYKTFEGGKHFYSIPEYKSLINRLFTELTDKNPVFIICSNVAIDLSDFDGLPCILGPGHFIEDLYVLAKCDYLLGPPSTYTKWASFYGNVPLKYIRSADDHPQLIDFNN
jgi:hypothetical protein